VNQLQESCNSRLIPICSHLLSCLPNVSAFHFKLLDCDVDLIVRAKKRGRRVALAGFPQDSERR